MYNSPLRDSSLFIFALCSFLILHLSTLHFFYCFFCFFNFLHNTLFSCCICFSCTFFSGFSCCTLSLASRCSFYHYCIPHSTKPVLSLSAGPNPVCNLSEVGDPENLWQWTWLEKRLNAYRLDCLGIRRKPC